MANFSPYANYGYVALVKEATAGTPVTPTNYLKIIEENIETSFGVSKVQEIAGSRERNIRSVPDIIEASGDIGFFVEPKMIGHFLRSLFGAPTTQELTASTAYRHVFGVTDTPKTYTIDCKPADAPWVHRFYGTFVTATNFEGDENKIKCTASLTPRKAFINTRVTTAVSSGTTLTVDQTSGLTSSDTILVLQKEDGYTTVKELTITSVDSETQLTTATIDTQIDVDDIVVIKASTETYDQDKVLTWLGGSQVYTGDDIDNTTAEDTESFSLTYNNEVEVKHFAGLTESARYAGDVIVKGYFGEGQLDKFYESESYLDKLRKNAQFGLRVLMQGETALEANSAVKASSTWGATANGFKVEASTAGKAGNDISVTIVVASDDNLSASISGNTVTISLANTTASKNTGTLIAAAVDALSGVDGTAEGTGAEEFTTAETSANLGARGSGTDVVGRDANEKPYLQFDNACTKLETYSPSSSEDDVLMEEKPVSFYKDVESGDNAKQRSTKVFLVNSVSSY